MADTKISALTTATTPLAGTEVLPIVQSGSTKKVANNDLRPKQIQSNATSGVMQIVGPSAAATRIMTIPDADFTAARTDAAQAFTGAQAINILTSNNNDTQNKTQQIQYENTNGGYSLVTGYSTSFYSYANSGTSGNVAYLSNGGSYLEIGAGKVGIVGSTFTIGSNTYTITNSTPNGYIYITPSASGEAATGTCTGLEYATERLRIDSSGDQTLKTGNLIQGTAAKGINFTANTGAAGKTSQLLNWYEEGTFTPALAFGGAGTGITYTTQTGYYTRIGRQVTLQIRIVLSSKGSATGGATIGGFPYNAGTGNYPAAIVDPSADFASLVTGGATFVVISSDTLYFMQQSTTGRTQMTQANFGNTADFRFAITYNV